MQEQATCVSRMAVIAGMLLIAIAGNAAADECAQGCAADLKECRKQAHVATDREIRPMLTDGSARRAVISGQANAMMASSEPPDARDAEVKRRLDERFRVCEAENNSCQTRCNQSSEKQKRSVIFK
jgi:hypothetical protein